MMKDNTIIIIILITLACQFPFPSCEMLPLLKDTNLFTEKLVGLSLIFFSFFGNFGWKLYLFNINTKANDNMEQKYT